MAGGSGQVARQVGFAWVALGGWLWGWLKVLGWLWACCGLRLALGGAALRVGGCSGCSGRVAQGGGLLAAAVLGAVVVWAGWVPAGGSGQVAFKNKSCLVGGFAGSRWLGGSRWVAKGGWVALGGGSRWLAPGRWLWAVGFSKVAGWLWAGGCGWLRVVACLLLAGLVGPKDLIACLSTMLDIRLYVHTEFRGLHPLRTPDSTTIWQRIASGSPSP